jgi:hypothetical protein
VEGEGFEPSKASLTDLQSAPFGHSGTPPLSRPFIGRKNDYNTGNVLCQLFFRSFLRYLNQLEHNSRNHSRIICIGCVNFPTIPGSVAQHNAYLKFFVLIKYCGRALTSMCVLDKYSPIIPKNIICKPPINKILYCIFKQFPK